MALAGAAILLVEDNVRLRGTIGRALSEAGARVSAVGDAAATLRAVHDDPHRELSMIILDVGLPDADGRDVCQALRAQAVTLPVMFLTARGQLDDVVSGFTAGGDDYLTKPFAAAELVARCAALVRRSREGSCTHHGPTRAAARTLALDPLAHGLRGDRCDVSLTPTEFRVLAALVTADGAVVRRRDLVRAGWSESASVSENVLDQYLARLRRKLAQAHTGPMRIHTVHGVGYRLG